MTGPEPIKRSWTAPIFTTIAALFLVAIFAVPGYIAGMYCRLTRDSSNANAVVVCFSGGPTKPCIGLRILLAPAWLAIGIAPPLRDFYLNQFIAGTRTKLIPPP